MAFKDPSIWEDFLCQNCGSVSHYINDVSRRVTYSDSSYRTASHLAGGIAPPVSLPWSAVTFARHKHVARLMRKYFERFKSRGSDSDRIKLLDFGGYNGFTCYGIKKLFDFECYVADVDPNGLSIAGSIGIHPIDVNSESLPADTFHSVISLHALEHLESPSGALIDIEQSLKADALAYIEVPNLLGAPLSDPAHLLAFSPYGLKVAVENAGLKVLEHGFVSTPSESVLYGHPNSHSTECQYVICADKQSSMYDDLPSGSSAELDGPPLLNQKQFIRAMKRANLRLGVAITTNYLTTACSFFLKTTIFRCRRGRAPLDCCRKKDPSPRVVRRPSRQERQERQKR